MSKIAIVLAALTLSSCCTSLNRGWTQECPPRYTGYAIEKVRN